MISNALGAAIGALVGDLLAVRRRHVLASLARAQVPRRRSVASAMYRSLGRGLVDLLLLLNPRRRVAVDLGAAYAQLTALNAWGRGAIVATAHTGNWDSVACGLGQKFGLLVVSKRLSVRGLDWLWQRIRRRHGVELAHPGHVLPLVGQKLGAGGLVAMMIDQAPRDARGAVELEFLGAKAWVDLAPALLALRFRVPLAVVFPWRRPDGSHALVWCGAELPPRRAGRAWAIEAMTRATRELEAFVRRHPDQWLWMHRRWKVVAASQRGSSGRATFASV